MVAAVRVHKTGGPEALTYDEAASTFSEILGRPIRYLGQPDDEARAAMLARGMPEFYVDALIDVAAGRKAQVVGFAGFDELIHGYLCKDSLPL